MESKHQDRLPPTDGRAALLQDEKTARRIVQQRGVRPEDVQDVTQEVLVVLARARPRFHAPGGRDPQDAWRAFIRVVIDRQVKSYRRSRARRAAGERGALAEACVSVPSMEEAMIASEPLLRMHQAMSALERNSPQLHAVVSLHLDGLSTPIIGRMLGIPGGTAWTRLRHARKMLRVSVGRLSRTRWKERLL